MLLRPLSGESRLIHAVGLLLALALAAPGFIMGWEARRFHRYRDGPKTPLGRGPLVWALC
eukprot:3605954-Prorocentrum_lima.AAC.1